MSIYKNDRFAVFPGHCSNHHLEFPYTVIAVVAQNVKPLSAKNTCRTLPVRPCHPIDMVDVIRTVLKKFIIAYPGLTLFVDTNRANCRVTWWDASAWCSKMRLEPSLEQMRFLPALSMDHHEDYNRRISLGCTFTCFIKLSLAATNSGRFISLT